MCSSPSAREANGRTAHASPPNFVCRNRSSLRQQGPPFAEAGRRRLRHPVPPDRPRRPRSAGDGAAPGRHPARDRPGAQRSVGRDGRAPAGGARQHEHRQRAHRAELAGSADHGRQRRAVHLPDSGSGREEAAGAAQVPEDRPADRDFARRQAHRALSVGSLQGHLQHQLRPSAAAASVADAADHRRDASSRKSRRRGRSRS